MQNTNSFDLLGSTAIFNFSDSMTLEDKKKIAEKLLKENKSIKTVLEKKEKIKGRLRKLSTNFIAGENTKEILYRENNCVFRFNIDETYFSPRLSNERKEIASKVKKGNLVLVMFAGVAPFSIVIAKNSKARKVFSNELNRNANKYAELNIKLNRLNDRVEIISGDANQISKKLKQKMDVIVMPRPQLKDTFLKEAFNLTKKGTRIYYYDFCKVEETKLIVAKVQEEAKKAKKKIKILNIKRAGEIAPYKIRLRVDFQVL